MARCISDRAPMRVPDIRKGDQVLVLSGKDAGKKGTVEHVVRNRQGFKKIAEQVRLRTGGASARWRTWPSLSRA